MINLDDFKNETIHFIGIGGCSMSALAVILKNSGFEVRGSDIRESSYTDILSKHEIPYTIGQSAENIKGAGLAVYSAAIRPDNPEYAYALENDIPLLERSKLLGIVSEKFENVVAVAGCHGKTTITSMLALILEKANLDPTVHVGGNVAFLDGGVRIGKSDIFVTEACEYVKSFLALHPKYAIVNNIDDDHLDYYKDINEIRDTFIDFIDLLPGDGFLFLNGDEELCLSTYIYSPCEVVTYGFNYPNNFKVGHLEFDENGCAYFDVYAYEQYMASVKLNVPGKHNVLNALAAISTAYMAFHVPVEVSAAALLEYTLAERRFQPIGEKNGVKYFHDYAHHPSEIKACLSAASLTKHNKLWAVFQCNSYTRARTLKDKYATAFTDADQVLMPSIYPGRDRDTGGMTSEMLFEAIQNGSGNCKYLPTFEEIRDYLDEHAKPGDIVVTLGSGDVNKKQYILLDK